MEYPQGLGRGGSTMSQQEMVYHDDANIRITNTGLLIRAQGSLYPMGHLSEATMGEIPASQGGAMTTLVLVLGIVLLISGSCSLVSGLASGDMVAFFLLATLFCVPGVLLLVYWARHKPAAMYVALVKGSFGSARAVSSPNRLYIENIVRALHQAQAQAQRDQHGTIVDNRIFAQNSFNHSSGNAVGNNAQVQAPW